MFVMDMPAVAAEAAPIVLAQVVTKPDSVRAQKSVGICSIIDNTPGWPANEVRVANGIDPATSVQSYLFRFEHQEVSLPGKITLRQAPTHGSLEFRNGEFYEYVPSSSTYSGNDTASFLVELGGYKVKVMYVFHVLTQGVADTPEFIEKTCGPKGDMWKISLSETRPGSRRSSPPPTWIAA